MLSAGSWRKAAAARLRMNSRENENAKREEFNQLLRNRYAGEEPVFDLARLESTGPDGQRELHDWNGRRIPAVLPAYTNDGGHLTPDARVRFARELIALLASLPEVP